MDISYATYHALREKRLALQKEAALLEEQEKDILYELTKGLSFNQKGYKLTQDGYTFKAVHKEGAQCENWELLLPYIRQTGELDLLHKRLTESAALLRLDAGHTIPGVSKTHKWTVTITKD